MLVFEAGKNNLRALSPPITIIHHFFSVVPCRPQSHCLLAFWAVWLPVKDPEDQEAEEARAFGCNVTIRYTRLACPMPHHVSRSNHSLWYCKHLGSLAFASVNSEHVWTFQGSSCFLWAESQLLSGAEMPFQFVQVPFRLIHVNIRCRSWPICI